MRGTGGARGARGDEHRGAGGPRAPLALLLLVAVPAAQGQVSELNRAEGFRWSRPTDFAPVPVSPDESGILRRYTQRPAAGREGIDLGGQVWVLEVPSQGNAWRAILDWAQERAPDQPQREVLLLGEDEETSERRGLRVTERTIATTCTEVSPIPLGLAWVLEGRGRVLVVFGFGLDRTGVFPWMHENYERWCYSIGRLELLTPAAGSAKDDAEVFRRRKLSDPAYRARVERTLVPGWHSLHSPNYVLIHDTNNVTLVQQVLDDLERLRRVFAADLPPAAPMDRPSTVRVFHDASEYYAYGVPPGTAGYYAPGSRELVLFDNARRDGLREWTPERTREVLYHEGFHQYLHDATGGVPPHCWFNEGLAEYYGQVGLGKDGEHSVGLASERLALLREELEQHMGPHFLGWNELLSLPQSAFYKKERIALCYAQAWSMAYFLREASVVQEHRKWKGLLTRYYEALHECYATDVARWQDRRRAPDRSEWSAAVERARRRALDRALAGVDLPELERAWLAWLRTL